MEAKVVVQLQSVIERDSLPVQPILSCEIPISPLSFAFVAAVADSYL